MTEASEFKRRVLNVLVVVLNLATVYFVLTPLAFIVAVMATLGWLGWEIVIEQFLISACGLATILVVSYLALGNAGVWNRIKRSSNSHAA